MNPRIPEEKIEEVRKSIDIVDLISEYVQLKKQGRNLVGLCPFHGEKTPSFTVSPDKQLYHCFGCGAGGNVFSFIMEIEGLSFVEAVMHIARRSNISLPKLNGQQAKREDKQNETWYRAHELAAKLYQHVLLKMDEGLEAREYLRLRGFTQEMIRRFQIGYAPDSWEFLTSFLQRRKFSMEEMVKCGLLSMREFDKKPFDRFRDRIMFPIWDEKGNIVGFGGRVLNEGNPKYLNSPESSLFNKSEILYYFHEARKQIRKKNKAVLFEGYVDVISSHRAGIDNGVATLGTALTEIQAKKLKRNADNVVLCYDSDDAGQNATLKNAEILTNAGLNVRVAKLPDGMDPDEYIQKYGPKRFNQDVIGQSLTLMGFKYEYYRRGKNLQDEGERLDYINQMLKEISKLRSAVERDHYLRQLADEFSLSLDALKQEQLQIYKRQKNNWKHTHKETSEEKTLKKIPKKLFPAHINAERLLIAHMLRSAEVAQRVQNKLGASFNIDEYEAIAAHLYRYYNEGFEPNPSMFIERLDDENLKRIATELAMMTINDELLDEELDDCVKQIVNYPKYLQIEKLKLERNKAEEGKDYLKAAEISLQIVKMEQSLKNA